MEVEIIFEPYLVSRLVFPKARDALEIFVNSSLEFEDVRSPLFARRKIPDDLLPRAVVQVFFQTD